MVMRKGKHQHNLQGLIYTLVFQLLEMKILWAKSQFVVPVLSIKAP